MSCNTYNTTVSMMPVSLEKVPFHLLQNCHNLQLKLQNFIFTSLRLLHVKNPQTTKVFLHHGYILIIWKCVEFQAAVCTVSLLL